MLYFLTLLLPAAAVTGDWTYLAHPPYQRLNFDRHEGVRRINRKPLRPRIPRRRCRLINLAPPSGFLRYQSRSSHLLSRADARMAHRARFTSKGESRDMVPCGLRLSPLTAAFA